MKRASRKQGTQTLRGAPRQGEDQGIGRQDHTGSDESVSTNGQEAKGEGYEEEAKAKEAKVLTEDPRPRMTVAEFLAKALLDAPPGMFVAGESRIIDAARKNDKRPAYIVWAVDDLHVMNLTGMPQLRDLYFYVKVPREFYEKHATSAT